MQCEFCDAVNDGDEVVVNRYLYQGDIYRVCVDHAEEKFPVDERKLLEFIDLPDGFEIISTEKRKSLEQDVNRFHFVEQAILDAAKIYNLETGYRITEVFASIRRKLESRIKNYQAICFDHGIDADSDPFVRPSSASCPNCTNKMFHLDGYRMRDALHMAMDETVKRCDVIACLKCGNVFIGKLS